MLGDASSLGLQQQPRWPACSRCRRQAPLLAQLQPFRRVFSRKELPQSLPDFGRSQGSSKTGSGVGPRDGQSATGEAAVAEQSAPSRTATGSFDDPCGAREALQQSSTRFVAETKLPTRTGTYRVRAYRHTAGGTVTEPMCIMAGNPEGRGEVVVRVHDACFTSEVLGSLKCDCAEQLQLAMRYIQDCPPGIIIYLQQEGRGIGLANKIAAYALQEKGFDTVDANRELGFDDDCREYTSVFNILADLGVASIKLMTNNPRKINMLEALGVAVTERIPCLVQSQEFNQGYLAVKAARMSHVLDGPQLDGSFCYWNHGGEPLPPASADSMGGGGNGSTSGSSHGSGSPSQGEADTSVSRSGVAAPDASTVSGGPMPPTRSTSSQPPSR